MTWLFDTLRSYPEIAIFLTLALGFYVGGLKFGKFSLGKVTEILLAGVLICQNRNRPALDWQYPTKRHLNTSIIKI
jgi:Predicted Permease Membrane Region